jgi:CRP/FNR family transcriptional regulator
MNTSCSVCPNRSSCFNELSINELNKVADNKAEIIYRKGETLIKQNASASHIYFIKKGLVKIHVENQKKNLILELVGKGSMLGITSLNYSKRYSFSVTAVNDVSACEIDIETIKGVMNSNVGFASVVINELNRKIEKLLNKVYCLSQKNIQSRMADLLLSFSNELFMKDEFVLSLSRHELAELTNMATENVVRILKEFENKGFIKLSGKTIQIINKEKLQKLSL